MRAVVQRVKKALVEVEGAVVGSIDVGLVVFVGVAVGDEVKDAQYLADKTVNLRVFDDHNGKLNHSLLDIGGQMLAVSQFTLMGDCKKGRRPSYVQAAAPSEAEPLYEAFVQAVRKNGIEVATGVFRTEMLVELENWGPVTLILDSRR